jgi:hypothetical protein
MTKSLFPSDAIALKEISTGGNSAGNGGDGHNLGNISNSPSISFNSYNKAEGADVHVKTGDQVYQKADWDAGGANAKANTKAYGETAKSKGDQNADSGHDTSKADSKAYGGTAKSNGDQSSDSGHDTSKVYADTTAYQTNFLAADMSQHVAAGIGGDGGNDNYAKGGEVEIKASIESANLNNVLNDSEHFHVDDFVHV